MGQGLHAAAVALAIFVSGSMPAVADSPSLPAYTGAMSFPDIQGPPGPEEFSWEVALGEGQELELIDDQHARVYYTEDHHPAFTITAEPAHDAHGTSVPTSLSVSGGNVITLRVHHRAGNPATGGAPFVYPIIAGAGWEGGFVTHQVQMPPPEAQPAEAGCVVPKLKGRTLNRSNRL